MQGEILTHLYDAVPNSLDYFWVGTTLQSGAFVQFGYGLEPGVYCLKGALLSGEFQCLGKSELLANSDPRWQWQYWPNLYATDFYYQIGPAESAGANSTWHLYSIEPSSVGHTNFVLDGTVVATIDSPLARSKEPPIIVAEKAGSVEAGHLGPVEFRNLSYLKEDGWHMVDSLVSLSGCGINASCDTNNSYGVSAKGSNHIVAGSGITIRRSGELIWTSGYVTLYVQVHPDVEFHVTTIIGDQRYTGNASISVPKGLDVRVSVPEPVIQTDGLLGVLGVNEHFQEWTGDVRSKNQSVLVSMSRNKTITATWRQELGWFAYSLLALIAIAVSLTGISAYMRSRKSLARNPLPSDTCCTCSSTSAHTGGSTLGDHCKLSNSGQLRL